MEDQFKFEHVLRVLLEAEPDASPRELAQRVRHGYPEGTYKPVRICEDIDHVLRRDGRFRAENVVLTTQQRLHIGRLKDEMIRSGAWLTRKTRGATRE